MPVGLWPRLNNAAPSRQPRSTPIGAEEILVDGAKVSNTFPGEEIERAALILNPAQAAAEGATRERLDRIGGHGALVIDWLDATPLDPVPLGQLADRIVAFLRVLDQARLDGVSARKDSEQAGIGRRLVIGILDQHTHFATRALQDRWHRQPQEIIRCARGFAALRASRPSSG